MDPGLVAILKNLGLSIGMDQLYEFGSRLKGQSPYEKGLSSQMGYMNRMMPDLANEAAGRPSFATKQMMRQVGSEVSRSQQSFAASQMRANPYMTSQTTPARVGQRQYQQMKTEAQANIMAQQQGRAQQMIYAGGQSAMMAMGEQEQYR